MARQKAASINLDGLFRPGSAARKIAERLLTGEPQARSQLVAGLGTSVTTVNRVVAQLEKAGAIVTREIGADGRQAVFRVVDVTGPKAARPYLHLGDQVRVVAASVSGDDMLIDVSVDKHTYRGVARGVVTNVNLGGYATVPRQRHPDRVGGSGQRPVQGGRKPAEDRQGAPHHQHRLLGREGVPAHRKRQLEERMAWPGWAETDLVFVREDGSPVHPEYFTWQFGRTARQLRLPHTALHALRHYHATAGLEAGWNCSL